MKHRHKEQIARFGNRVKRSFGGLLISMYELNCDYRHAEWLHVAGYDVALLCPPTSSTYTAIP